MLNRRRLRRPARGLGIVELLVGLAVGLFVVAGGLILFAGFVESDRQLIVDTRLQQDLRAASDMITRDIRRSGYWAAADSTLWTSGAASTPRNKYTDIRTGACSAVAATAQAAAAPASEPATGSSTCFWLDRDGDTSLDADEFYGYELSNGAVWSVVGGAARVQLTDPRVMTVTDLRFAWNNTVIDASSYCVVAPTTDQPRVVLREVEVVIRAVPPGVAASANVARELRSNVRVRNDYVSGYCPT